MVTYAIFKAAGFQYRAELGAVLRVPSLDVESGETITFEDVLMGASDGETLIGTPTLEGAKVQAEVLRHGRADKIIVFKFKRRKNYRKKTGHRQDFTEIRVNEIDLGGEHKVSLEQVEKAKRAPKKQKAEAAEQPRERKAATKKKTRAEAATSEAGARATSKKKTSSKKKTISKKKEPKAEASAKKKPSGGSKKSTKSKKKS